MNPFKARSPGIEVTISDALDAVNQRMYECRQYEDDGQLERMKSDITVLTSIVANLLDAYCTTPRQLLDMCDMRYHKVEKLK